MASNGYSEAVPIAGNKLPKLIMAALALNESNNKLVIKYGDLLLHIKAISYDGSETPDYAQEGFIIEVDEIAGTQWVSEAVSIRQDAS